jgi:hypothetical protein
MQFATTNLLTVRGYSVCLTNGVRLRACRHYREHVATTEEKTDKTNVRHEPDLNYK